MYISVAAGAHGEDGGRGHCVCVVIPPAAATQCTLWVCVVPPRQWWVACRGQSRSMPRQAVPGESPSLPLLATLLATAAACGCDDFCAGRCAFNATAPQSLSLFRRTPVRRPKPLPAYVDQQ